MNPKQKAYDSYDYTTKMLKVAESQYHNQNLYLIRNRKPITFKTTTNQYEIKHPSDPINKYFKTKNDKYITSKLMKISQKHVKPQLNEDFIINEQKKKKYSILKKEEDMKVIQKQNESMHNRISNLRSFISVKDMDKTFNEDHQKMMTKLRRVENGKLLLPKLTYKPLNTQRSQTESNLEERKTKETPLLTENA